MDVWVLKHIVDFYFNTDGYSTEHRISSKVTLAPNRILLKWRPSTKKSEAQPLSSTGQVEKVVIVKLCRVIDSFAEQCM